MTFTLTVIYFNCEVVLDKAKHGEKVEIVEIVVKVPQHTLPQLPKGKISTRPSPTLRPRSKRN